MYVLDSRESISENELQISEVISGNSTALSFTWSPLQFSNTSTVRVGLLALERVAAPQGENINGEKRNSVFGWQEALVVVASTPNNGTMLLDVSRLAEEFRKFDLAKLALIKQFAFFLGPALNDDKMHHRHRRFSLAGPGKLILRAITNKWVARSMLGGLGGVLIGKRVDDMAQRLDKEGRERLCREWHKRDPGVDVTKLLPCPQTAAQARFEVQTGNFVDENTALESVKRFLFTLLWEDIRMSRFHPGSDFCIRSSPDTDPRQQCCYKNGLLNTDLRGTVKLVEAKLLHIS